MESFKVMQNYGSHCDECGKVKAGKSSNVLEFKGVQYVLCEDCFKLFIGQLYLSHQDVFHEFISALAKNDRKKILSIINK